MYKKKKKQIQRLRRNRLWVSIFTIGHCVCSLGLFMSVLKYRPQKQQSLVLELSQLVEDYADKDNSANDRKKLLDEIKSICAKNELLLSLELAKILDQYRYRIFYEHNIRFFESEQEQLQEHLQELKWLQGNWRQSRRFWKPELEQEVLLAKYRLLKFVITKELEQKHGLKLIQRSDLYNYLNNETKRERTFLLSAIFLSLSVLLLLISLFILTRLQTSHNLPPNSHLIAFLPEECVAEMGALARRMRRENASTWEIRLRLLEEFLSLIWVFYIQIKLENLSLPFQDNQIDE